MKSLKIGAQSTNDQKIIQNYIDNNFREIMGLEGEQKVRMEQNIWEEAHSMGVG